MFIAYLKICIEKHRTGLCKYYGTMEFHKVLIKMLELVLRAVEMAYRQATTGFRNVREPQFGEVMQNSLSWSRKL